MEQIQNEGMVYIRGSSKVYGTRWAAVLRVIDSEALNSSINTVYTDMYEVRVLERTVSYPHMRREACVCGSRCSDILEEGSSIFVIEPGQALVGKARCRRGGKAAGAGSLDPYRECGKGLWARHN
jgi:hypothetical protein